MDVIGQVLMVGPNETESYYTDWLPRGGGRVLAALEVIALDEFDPPLCTLRVQTKNSQDPDSACIEIAAVDVGVGVESVVSTGCRELVRYQVQVKGTEGVWAHLRPIPPSWLRN